MSWFLGACWGFMIGVVLVCMANKDYADRIRNTPDGIVLDPKAWSCLDWKTWQVPEIAESEYHVGDKAYRTTKQSAGTVAECITYARNYY